MGVSLRLLHKGTIVGWGCPIIGWWGRYLSLRGTRWQGSEKAYTTRSFMLLCSSSIIIEGHETRRISGVRHVALMGERRGTYRTWVERPERNKYLNDLGVDGRTILNWIFKKWCGKNWLDCSGSGEGQVVGACKCNNELGGSIKWGKFLDQLRTYWLLQ
jgi:hypothetical protein